MLSQPEIDVLLLAFKIASCVVAATALPALFCALLLARAKGPVSAVLQALLMLPLVMPPVATGYLLLLAFGRSSLLGSLIHDWTGIHLSYTTAAAVLAASAVSFPLFVESTRQAMLGIDPHLESVSRTLGRGRVSTFLRVTLPLSMPGFLSGAALCFGRALGEFGATIVFAGSIDGETRQIPLAVYALLNVPGGEESALRLVIASVVLSLIALGMAALLLRWRHRRGGRT
ncbi:MAG: molybdate ABC transporter permease subunit [Planctomycetota bacterium]